MRIATLLASLQGKHTVSLAHWAYAQQITEGWRAMLHRVLLMLGETGHSSKDAQTEDFLEGILAQEGPQSLRTLQRRAHVESAVLKRLIQSMEFTGRIGTKKQGRTLYAFLPQDADVPDGETENDEEREQNDIPF